MLILPKNLPLISQLQADGCNVTDVHPTNSQSLTILFLNLMPQKEEAEEEIYRALESIDYQINIRLLKMSNLTYKTTPQTYMDTFYEDIADVMQEDKTFDALIINGAPFERFEYEEIRYWEQLCTFFQWTDTHVRSCLHICWSAFARIYYDCGIHFKRNRFQWSGVYPHNIIHPTPSLIDATCTSINLPVSRPWYLSHDEIENVKELTIVAESPISGPGLIIGHNGHHIYAVSHPEYAPNRLATEYKRDCEAGKNPMFPYNYFEDDDSTKSVRFSWKKDRDMIFKNWIENFVKSN